MSGTATAYLSRVEGEISKSVKPRIFCSRLMSFVDDQHGASRQLPRIAGFGEKIVEVGDSHRLRDEFLLGGSVRTSFAGSHILAAQAAPISQLV
jgi:hypothetical protein